MTLRKFRFQQDREGTKLVVYSDNGLGLTTLAKCDGASVGLPLQTLLVRVIREANRQGVRLDIIEAAKEAETYDENEN